MTPLWFSPEAVDVLTALEADPSRDICVGRIHVSLDRLEADPGDARNRRRRFATLGLWGIPVVCDVDDWLVLWELTERGVVVHHIVPAP